jgi:hypothetical protein
VVVVKARYLVIAGLLSLLIGWALPFILYQQIIDDGAATLADILWIIVAPGVVCVYSWPFYIAGIALLIGAMVLYIRNKMKEA